MNDHHRTLYLNANDPEAYEVASIVENQRAANRSLGCDSARNLARNMKHLSEAERAALLALLAASTNTAVDIVFLCDDVTEMHDAASIVAGVLPRASSVPYAWRVSGDAQFALIALNKDGSHHE